MKSDFIYEKFIDCGEWRIDLEWGGRGRYSHILCPKLGVEQRRMVTGPWDSSGPYHSDDYTGDDEKLICSMCGNKVPDNITIIVKLLDVDI